MNLIDREGPVEKHIPARRHYTCSGCKYFNQRLVRSGLDPLYRHDCEHTEAEEKPMKLSFSGNLPGDGVTPKWCPFLNQDGSEQF